MIWCNFNTWFVVFEIIMSFKPQILGISVLVKCPKGWIHDSVDFSLVGPKGVKQLLALSPLS